MARVQGRAACPGSGVCSHSSGVEAAAACSSRRTPPLPSARLPCIPGCGDGGTWLGMGAMLGLVTDKISPHRRPLQDTCMEHAACWCWPEHCATSLWRVQLLAGHMGERSHKLLVEGRHAACTDTAPSLPKLQGRSDLGGQHWHADRCPPDRRLALCRPLALPGPFGQAQVRRRMAGCAHRRWAGAAISHAAPATAAGGRCGGRSVSISPCYAC